MKIKLFVFLINNKKGNLLNCQFISKFSAQKQINNQITNSIQSSQEHLISNDNQPLDKTTSKLIYETVQKCWLKLSENLSSDKRGFLVISAFVAISSNKAKVLSIGTGSKWIFGEKIATNGKVVQDCHAEIIAKRALQCVLYENLLGNLFVDH